jgi:aspartate aminotransferase-like enzyme
MTTDRQFGHFFLPGPTEVHPDVLRAQTGPMIGHRVAEMEALIGHIQPRLQSIFRTARPVYISASSATGLMEGAVRNGARARVLSLVNGAFSERFFQIALANGLHADRSRSSGAPATRRRCWSTRWRMARSSTR